MFLEPIHHSSTPGQESFNSDNLKPSDAAEDPIPIVSVEKERYLFISDNLAKLNELCHAASIENLKRYARKLKDNGHLLDTTPYLDNVVQYDSQNMTIDRNGQRIYDSMNIGPLAAVSVPGKLITNTNHKL